MEINFAQKKAPLPESQQETKVVTPNQGKVTISMSPRKEREMLDKDGNVIDPRSKQILKSVNQKEN